LTYTKRVCPEALLKDAANRKWFNATVGVVMLSTIAPSVIPVRTTADEMVNFQVTIVVPRPELFVEVSLAAGKPEVTATEPLAMKVSTSVSVTVGVVVPDP